jgi:surfeit locus 1 family protein
MTARWRRLVVPATMTLAMLVVTIGLGTWQVNRLQWKRTILDRIESAERSPPAPLPEQPEPFMKVAVSGRFASDKVALYGAEVRETATGPTMGARLIVPLRRDGAATVLVDRGWVPLKQTSPLDQPTGLTTIEGFIHPGATASWFSATDDLANRHFHALDPARIGAALGVAPVAPFVLVALGRPTHGQFPAPAQDLPRPPNNHLVYAITWYGFAVTLLIVFVIWARKESTP